ncbi:MAG: hypothetical protein KGY66_01215 [Candidatus Thermoplasmatota archaeon]|nr:hypothetical protein [Candidatus Thermoplasmatota archaeon]MBS3789518.1 hypothetical protein [Candidatus Thermoplasmatota archaeon]
MVEKCPRCGNTVVKDSKEEDYWCVHCQKYYSYEKVEEG